MPSQQARPRPADTRLRDCQAQLSCCRAAPPSMRSGERRGADLLSRFPAGSRLPPPRPPLASPSALKKSSRVPQKPADFGNIIRKSSASGIICRFQLGSVNARLAACGAWSDGQHHPYSLPLSRAGSTGCPGGASKVSCEGRLRRLPDLAGFFIFHVWRSGNREHRAEQHVCHGLDPALTVGGQ